MFAGIIQQLGQLSGTRPVPAPSGGTAATQLELTTPDSFFAGLAPGASVAVNGVCLTLTGESGQRARFDVIPESWRASNLSTLKTGDLVNLERSLKVGDPIDGHFVQGHVDAVGTVTEIDTAGGEWRMWVASPPAARPYLIPKGSVAIDGISLTLAAVEPERFAVAIIPTTLRTTNLHRRQVGDRVNIETDLLARTIVQRLEQLQQHPAAAGVTWETLRAAGFVA
jgi:riboflavin synthase